MRSYDLAELEEISALSRRTISDYVSRGLLAGPSHRGRGARYSQRDLDALRVIPRLRTVLKPEFPSLSSVREFLRDLNAADLRHLVRLTNERVFEIEIRRIRVRNRLNTFLPAVSPERLTMSLEGLTPEQICAVDRGQIQIGTLLDIESLTGSASAPYSSSQEIREDDDPTDSEFSEAVRDRIARNRFDANAQAASNSAASEQGQRDQYERFGNSTVQVRIERAALENRVRSGDRDGGLSDTIRDFAQQIETMLKASG